VVVLVGQYRQDWEQLEQLILVEEVVAVGQVAHQEAAQAALALSS
jgi:hypothetical protein